MATNTIPVLQNLSSTVLTQPLQQQQQQQAIAQQQPTVVTVQQPLTVQTAVAAPASPELASPNSLDATTVIYPPSAVQGVPMPVVIFFFFLKIILTIFSF
jgi:hypothetical protein